MAEKQIWDFLKKSGATDAGAAGLMGNLFAESGLSSINLQNSYEKSLGYTDSTYTQAVDSGAYTNFAKDSAGYGLAQWTYWTRKENLLKFAKEKGTSVGDLETQLEFLWKELGDSFPKVLTTICTTDSVLVASNSVLLDFERPADQSVTTQNKRANYGQGYFEKYSAQEVEETEEEEVRYQTVKECPTWAQATIQKMLDNKEIVGDGTGIDLTMDMIRTFVCVDKMMERKGG